MRQAEICTHFVEQPDGTLKIGQVDASHIGTRKVGEILRRAHIHLSQQHVYRPQAGASAGPVFVDVSTLIPLVISALIRPVSASSLGSI